MEVATHQQSRAADEVDFPVVYGRYKEATGTESIGRRRVLRVSWRDQRTDGGGWNGKATEEEVAKLKLVFSDTVRGNASELSL